MEGRNSRKWGRQAPQKRRLGPVKALTGRLLIVPTGIWFADSEEEVSKLEAFFESNNQVLPLWANRPWGDIRLGKTLISGRLFDGGDGPTLEEVEDLPPGLVDE